MLRLNVGKLREAIQDFDGFRTVGRLHSATGMVTCSLRAAIGDQCEIVGANGRSLPAEVIGFVGSTTQLAPYEPADDLRSGMCVLHSGQRFSVPAGDGLLGRVIDGLGRPLDDRGPITNCVRQVVSQRAPSAMDRASITRPFVTGQRAIDSLLTCGRGQRVGIFAGSGVGKSTLLGEIAKGSDADVNVIAMIGERGRELRPFLDHCLGPKGLERSAIVVSTSDQTALMRIRAAQAAITIADHFRERGANVLFILDSLTRLAMAQRELGLSRGEPPSARGYTPSVFQLMATLLERLGNSAHGSITGIVTVLVEGDDLDEPVSDAARALLDGHIVLDRKLAERGHYPAIDIARSISRVFRDVSDAEHQVAARKLRAIMAAYAEVEDLLRIGAYVKGTSAQTDKAILLMRDVEKLLRQQIDERSMFQQTFVALANIACAWPF
jgi:flagellum-specific ATP synthase